MELRQLCDWPLAKESSNVHDVFGLSKVAITAAFIASECVARDNPTEGTRAVGRREVFEVVAEGSHGQEGKESVGGKSPG